MGKYHLCPLFLFFFLQFCYGEMQIHEVNENMKIHKCVVTIIQRSELVNSTDITLINVNVSLVKELHSLFEHPVRFVSRSFHWPKNTLDNYGYIIQCADYMMFAHELESVRRDSFWNPRAMFVIIIEYIEDSIQEISDILIYNHIDDVAVVVYSEDEEVLVYTFGLEHDECDRPVSKKLQLLSRCPELHNIDKIYVGTRKTKLGGCHVKFISHEYWPFVSLSGKETVENYLLDLIREHEEIVIELVNFGEAENFGKCLDNFTLTGMLHEIEIYNVEGAIGGYRLTVNRIKTLDFIDPYLVDSYKIIIPRAPLLNKWNGVLKQFGAISVWIIFGTFCVFSIIVILMKIFKTGQTDTTRDVLIVWGYFMGNINQKQHSKSGVPYRMVLLNITLFVFIISITTQASLLSSTTQPIRDYQPDAVEEVVSNYQLILGPSQYAYLKTNPAINITKAKLNCESTLDCMMQVVNIPGGRVFTAMSDLYHQGYYWKFADENGELKLYTIKESLGTLLQTAYIRKGSSLVEPFNKLLLRARSGGLIEHYVEVLNHKERVKYKFHARTEKPQTLKGLKGVFMVLISGYGLSLISLLFEYLHYS